MSSGGSRVVANEGRWAVYTHSGGPNGETLMIIYIHYKYGSKSITRKIMKYNICSR